MNGRILRSNTGIGGLREASFEPSTVDALRTSSDAEARVISCRDGYALEADQLRQSQDCRAEALMKHLLASTIGLIR